ncbi:MAG: dienelactone hydrolase family protein [Acidimicrobiales bacterium]|nr:dienelactone hydrolase family protein [Acidimicrobiales bacterium]MCB1248827.1 dienelactone hydrolase family protein [Acidimicrobiales bacterium]MCB1261321.1 dienelactone hydrolase family protein [Acidimicrobiales bacterium]
MTTTFARHRSSRWALPVLVGAALVSAACAADTDATSSSGTTPTTGAGAAAPVDYATPGPYRVGTTELEISAEPCPTDPATSCPRKAVVFYPADPTAAADTTRIEGYRTSVAFPESARAVLPAEFDQEIDLTGVEVYDAPVASDEGPFPVVLHSHGFSGYYLFESRSMAHLASWGFVVAAPDHKERSLGGLLFGGGAGADATADQDVRDMQNLLTALRDENVSDGMLKGASDFEELAVTGHSAGGSTAGRLIAVDNTVDAFIGKAPVPPVALGPDASRLTGPERIAALEEAFQTTDPPGVPVMLIAGERDATIALDTIEQTYDWLDAPKRLVVVANAGHNAFTDLCGPIRAQGGLSKFAEQVPALAPVLQLGEDGCVDGFLPPEQGDALINHLLVAQLRWVFKLDPTDASLSPDYLAAQFPEAFGSEQADPTPATPAG